MIGYIIISLISLLIIIGIYKWLSGRALDKIQRYKESEFYLEREKYKRELDRQFEEERKNYINELLNIKKEIEDKKEFNTSLQKVREEELGRIMEEKRKNAESRLALEIEEWARSAQEAASSEFKVNEERLNDIINDYKFEKEELEKEVNEYKEKRDAINQDILRTRALEEQQDFYRIQLDETSKEDIAFLLSIINRFNNKEVIYKLIWSEYIQKPFKSMMNRVLSGRDPKNVIYIIKNMDTNEVYIGKTKAEVSKRWTEHIKTSLNIGTISRTNIHKALFNNWDKFSFTVLEEVPLDVSLGEREKYYIKFYESDIFGYNIKSGG